jgi:hypothetical protein
MPFVTFDLERWQSTWENRVRYNLSESGVHPLSVRELLALAQAAADPLLDVRLGYSQSNGTDALRERIAALYRGATPDQVLVTNGSAEANYVAALRVIEPGDQVAMLLPNYLQLWGHVQNLGAQVRPFRLHEERGWAPDPAEIRSAIAPGTKLVVVTNPHNPTGHILADAMRRAIIDRTAEVGAWLLADEVYMGAERDGNTTASFWGSYDRLLCVAGLSKAYGLPGLRIGWLVGPAPIVADAWARMTTRPSAPPVRATTSPRWRCNPPCASASSPGRAGSCGRIIRCSSSGSRRLGRPSAGWHRKRGRFAGCATARAWTAKRSWSASAPLRACCWCRASTSACRATCASDSATRVPSCARRWRPRPPA